MSYTIKRYGQPNIILPNGAINTETSVTLIGKNYASYGQMLDQNSMTLLQNSAGETPPANPQYGQLWFDAGTKALKVYTGIGYKTLGSAVASPTAPPNPNTGDLWFDTTDEILSVYNGSSWVVIGPSIIRGTGVLSTTIMDTAGLTHSVVEILVGAMVVGIVSKDPKFVPKTPISGFPEIGPGYNVATVINTVPQYYNGTATNSLNLENLPANAFMSTIGNTGTIGNISVVNNAGITTGNLQNFSFYNTNNDGVIENSQLGGNILIDLNVGGNVVNVATFYGSNGNVSFSGDLTANNIHANNISANSIVGDIVHRVNTGVGLIGGPITDVGTISLLTSVAANANANISGTIGGVIPDGQTIVMSNTGVITSMGSPIGQPTITGFTPVQGSQAGGTLIFVTGTYFAGTTEVTVAGIKAAHFSVSSGTQMAIVTAASPTLTSGPIVITTPGGTATSASTFAYVVVPAISTFRPISGPTSGGTVVFIDGYNFTNVQQVTLAGVAAQSFTVHSQNYISALTAPVSSEVTGPVRVQTAYGNALSDGIFTYSNSDLSPTISDINPTSGPITGGTTITITGTNLSGTIAVTVDGTPTKQIVKISETEVQCITAAAPAGSGEVMVYTVHGTAMSSEHFTYYANEGVPTISFFTPLSGPASGGGTAVTIAGTNLNIVTAVSIAGIPAASWSVTSPTQIIAITGASPTTGPGYIVLQSPMGSVVSSKAFTYYNTPDDPILSHFAPQVGPVSGRTQILIEGENFQTSLGAAAISTVLVASVAAVQISIKDDGNLTAVTSAVPAATQGRVLISGIYGSATSAQVYVYDEIPVIQDFSPLSGPASGATPIVVTGSDFIGSNIATVAGTQISGESVNVVNDNIIELVSPPKGAASSGAITVTNSAGTSLPSGNVYTYQTAGTVTSVAVGTGLVSTTSPNPITTTGTISLLKAVPQVGGVGGTIGGVIPDGSTITINSNGVISANENGTVKSITASTGIVCNPTTITSTGTVGLLTASTTQLGGVMVDGTTIAINGSGVISALQNGTVTSIAGGTGIACSPATITSTGSINLLTASTTQLGGVKVDGSTITINGSGVISAVTVTPSTNLQVNSLGVGVAPSGAAGEIRATNNITAFYSSDERLKENFELIEDPLEKAKMIRGYFFDWTQQFIDDHGGEDGVFIRKHNVGVKAQEVQEALPEVVTERSDGYLAVRYEMLIPLLFECINALVERIESK